MGATRMAYDVEGWGTCELWAAEGRLVWHELPRPQPTNQGPPRASSQFQPNERAATRVKRERVGSVTVAQLAARIRRHFAGRPTTYDDVELDLEWCTPFQRAVADVLRSIP